MKSIAKTILVAVLTLGVLAAAGWQATRAQTSTPTATPAAAQQPQPEEPLRTVSVAATGQVDATPDQALVRLGVQTDAATAAQALTNNSTAMQALISALRQAGVAQTDIQTQTVSLYPRYENNPRADGTYTVTGYTASNVVQVRVRQLSGLGALLDSAVAAGGNTIESIAFDVSEQSDLLDQARENAMVEARRKAEQLAGLAGAKLGQVVSINENSYTPPMPYPRGLAAADQAQAVPVEPGQQTLSVDVSVTWQLIPVGLQQNNNVP